MLRFHCYFWMVRRVARLPTRALGRFIWRQTAKQKTSQLEGSGMRQQVQQPEQWQLPVLQRQTAMLQSQTAMHSRTALLLSQVNQRLTAEQPIPLQMTRSKNGKSDVLKLAI
ncbi:TPA: hypothetical protein ACH3X1_000767 [Trebouxia sp. C0004]